MKNRIYVSAALLSLSAYCAGGEDAGKTPTVSDVPQVAQPQAPSYFSSAYLFPEQPHIVECSPCIEFIADLEGDIEKEVEKRKNRSAGGELYVDKDKVQQDYLYNAYYQIHDTKGRYPNAKQLQRLDTLEQCVKFLQNWPNYSSDVAKTKDLFAKVDTKKLPSQHIINKAKTVVAKDLTNQEAWELHDCEPCQEIKKAFLNTEGSFDAEKAKVVRSAASHLMSRKGKVALPKTIAQKAEAVEACFTIIDAYRSHEEKSKNLEKYLS